MLIIVVAVLYEGLKTLREILAVRDKKKDSGESMEQINTKNNDQTRLLDDQNQSKVGIK